MNIYLLGTILNTASLLMIGGAGAYIAIKCGHYNLGGEGQVYAGGFFAAIILSRFSSMPGFLALFICFIFTGLLTAFLAFLSALLKQYRKVEVLLSSYLLSSAVIPIIDWLIAVPCRGKTNNLLATEFIPKSVRFNSILPPSPLNGTFFFGLFICILLYLFLKYSNLGKELKIYGISPRFALYSGFSEEKLNFFSVSISGFLHGILGMFCVCGTYFTCHSGFYSGFGWNSLSTALLAGSNPLLIIPAAIVISALTNSASQFSLLHNFGFDMGNLLQGLIMFCILFSLALTRTHSERRMKK